VLGLTITIVRMKYSATSYLLWKLLDFARMFHALLSLPFLVFAFPLMLSTLTDTVPTGYDATGVLCPRLTGSQLRECMDEDGRRVNDMDSEKMELYSSARRAIEAELREQRDAIRMNGSLSAAEKKAAEKKARKQYRNELQRLMAHEKQQALENSTRSFIKERVQQGDVKLRLVWTTLPKPSPTTGELRVRLAIVGEGPLHPAAQQFLHSLDQPNVEVTVGNLHGISKLTVATDAARGASAAPPVFADPIKLQATAKLIEGQEVHVHIRSSGWTSAFAAQQILPSQLNAEETEPLQPFEIELHDSFDAKFADLAGSMSRLSFELEWVPPPMFTQGRLSVVVEEGVELKPMDSNGLADPYAKLSWRSEKHKTKVLREHLNAHWGETFQFQGCTLEHLKEDLQVEVKDSDSVKKRAWRSVKAHNLSDGSKNESMGTATVNMDKLLSQVLSDSRNLAQEATMVKVTAPLLVQVPDEEE